MSSTLQSGFGVLSQGELITSQEQDRLVAKRAWLQLYNYLQRHDERILAARLPVPWSLEEDAEIRNLKMMANQSLAYLNASDSTIDEIGSDEMGAVEGLSDLLPVLFNDIKKFPRVRWILDKILSYNPLTVLDCGVGWGEITFAIAKLGIHVVAVAPCEGAVSYAKQRAKESEVSIEFIHGLLEACDFGVRKFDIVLCGEVIEHVANDIDFVDKAVGLARQAVIITTPHGSVERGFLGQRNDHTKVRGQHIRAYSKSRFQRLINDVQRNNTVCAKGVDEIQGIKNLSGEVTTNFCTVLEVVNDAGVKCQNVHAKRADDLIRDTKGHARRKSRKKESQPA